MSQIYDIANHLPCRVNFYIKEEFLSLIYVVNKSVRVEIKLFFDLLNNNSFNSLCGLVA